MWNYEHINSICNQFEIKNQQKLHIDRILSSKSRTDSSKPYKPYFLITKPKKNLMLEEEKNKIDQENQNLLIKVINAKLKPSKYSQIPKECPAFNKQRMYTKRIYKVDYYQNENINKNLELNKLTQMIRSSFFDRKSVNTNINLTTKEQSDHFRIMNEKLNDLLFIDTKKIRGRFTKKGDDLNVSSDIKKRNYDKCLNSLKDEAESPKRKTFQKFVRREKEKERKEREKEKEKEKEILIKKTNFDGAESHRQDDFEYINSDLNLLGSRKYSERVNLNKEAISKEISEENNKSKNKKNKGVTKLNYFKKMKCIHF